MPHHNKDNLGTHLGRLAERHRVAFVIPTFNHGRTVADVARGACETGLVVFVVNDGSTDGTSEALRAVPDLRVISHETNRGKGAALVDGFAAAAAAAFDWVISVDADGQHNPGEAHRLLDVVSRGERAIVVGRREEMVGADVPWTSRFGRGFSNFWVWLSGGPHLSDSQSGFRLYPVPEVLHLGTRARRFEYEVEVLVRAHRAGLSIKEVPVSVVYSPPGGRVSHFRPWVDFLRNSVTFTRLIVSRVMSFARPARALKEKTRVSS